jgi:hypothetical protein
MSISATPKVPGLQWREIEHTNAALNPIFDMVASAALVKAAAGLFKGASAFSSSWQQSGRTLQTLVSEWRSVYSQRRATSCVL